MKCITRPGTPSTFDPEVQARGGPERRPQAATTRARAAMKHESTSRVTCGTTGLAAGLLLAACLVLTPGCGTATANPQVSPETTGLEAVPTGRVAETSPRVKAGRRRKVEGWDDLKERRAKDRLSAQAQG
jgi:hypothetical protein